jgi:hypothetical protein
MSICFTIVFQESLEHPHSVTLESIGIRGGLSGPPLFGKNRTFAADALPKEWWGKEHDWVNRYVFGYLIKHCSPNGPLHDAAQIGIEVGVPQPPGYVKKGVLRDVVIWEHPMTTCWNSDGARLVSLSFFFALVHP